MKNSTDRDGTLAVQQMHAGRHKSGAFSYKAARRRLTDAARGAAQTSRGVPPFRYGRGPTRRGGRPGGIDDMSSPLNLLCRCLALLPLAWSLGVGAAHAATRSKPPAADRVAAQAQQPPAATQGHKAKAKALAQAKSQAKATKSTGRKAEAARAAGRGAVSAKAGARKAEGVRSVGRAGASAKTAAAGKSVKSKATARAAPPSPKSRLDYSGRKRVGKASYYARHFGGRKMADGTPMRLNHHNAASKTLPLGTTAKVTNLKTGKSAVVKIQDRGPFVQGRIVDLSPATARAVGITSREGVAPVEVTPIEVPMPDGSVRLGEAARDPLARQQIARARD